MREPVLARLRPVEMNPLDGIPESVQQLPLQLAGLFHSGLKISYRRLCSHTGPDNRGNIFCASAESFSCTPPWINGSIWVRRCR